LVIGKSQGNYRDTDDERNNEPNAQQAHEGFPQGNCAKALPENRSAIRVFSEAEFSDDSRRLARRRAVRL
jgi:hypothetical protein